MTEVEPVFQNKYVPVRVSNDIYADDYRINVLRLFQKTSTVGTEEE
jgi:hypothetical protein